MQFTIATIAAFAALVAAAPEITAPTPTTSVVPTSTTSEVHTEAPHCSPSPEAKPHDTQQECLDTCYPGFPCMPIGQNGEFYCVDDCKWDDGSPVHPPMSSTTATPTKGSDPELPDPACTPTVPRQYYPSNEICEKDCNGSKDGLDFSCYPSGFEGDRSVLCLTCPSASGSSTSEVPTSTSGAPELPDPACTPTLPRQYYPSNEVCEKDCNGSKDGLDYSCYPSGFEGDRSVLCLTCPSATLSTRTTDPELPDPACTPTLPRQYYPSNEVCEKDCNGSKDGLDYSCYPSGFEGDKSVLCLTCPSATLSTRTTDPELPDPACTPTLPRQYYPSNEICEKDCNGSKDGLDYSCYPSGFEGDKSVLCLTCPSATGTTDPELPDPACTPTVPRQYYPSNEVCEKDCHGTKDGLDLSCYPSGFEGDKSVLCLTCPQASATPSLTPRAEEEGVICNGYQPARYFTSVSKCEDYCSREGSPYNFCYPFGHPSIDTLKSTCLLCTQRTDTDHIVNGTVKGTYPTPPQNATFTLPPIPKISPACEQTKHFASFEKCHKECGGWEGEAHKECLMTGEKGEKAWACNSCTFEPAA